MNIILCEYNFQKYILYKIQKNTFLNKQFSFE